MIPSIPDLYFGLAFVALFIVYLRIPTQKSNVNSMVGVLIVLVIALWVYKYVGAGTTIRH